MVGHVMLLYSLNVFFFVFLSYFNGKSVSSLYHGRVQTIVTIKGSLAPPRWNNTRCVTMGLDARHPDIVACEQQMRRPACASAQSVSGFVILSLERIIATLTCCIQNFNILASLCSSTGWLEPYLGANPEESFSCDVAQFCESQRIII